MLSEAKLKIFWDEKKMFYILVTQCAVKEKSLNKTSGDY